MVKFFLLFIFAISCSSAEKITVLTRPVNRPTVSLWYHSAVVHSLLRGLSNLEVDFNYNPIDESEVGSIVFVPSNEDALEQAIEWKKSGKIKKLLAGPNHVISPLENAIVLSPYIDRYLVNSEWTRTAYLEEAPEMIRNIAIWPAGVDPDVWAPSQLYAKQNQVLVYWKTEAEEFCEAVEELLRKYHWEPIRIRYGSYDQATFRQVLDCSVFAVFISRSESQGLALAEAWSMDVPTFVWNPQELTINERRYTESSACPYLTPHTGIDWKNLEEFEALLQAIHPEDMNLFHPREWVLDNMSDTASAAILLSIIGSIEVDETN